MTLEKSQGLQQCPAALEHCDYTESDTERAIRVAAAGSDSKNAPKGSEQCRRTAAVNRDIRHLAAELCSIGGTVTLTAYRACALTRVPIDPSRRASAVSQGVIPWTAILGPLAIMAVCMQRSHMGLCACVVSALSRTAWMLVSASDGAMADGRAASDSRVHGTVYAPVMRVSFLEDELHARANSAHASVGPCVASARWPMRPQLTVRT
jgi:hypothetical protein